ncbi:MAG: RNA 2',3'-cyclic phosphodiesterase [Micavibrio aeruginosavorus]|uniref:RNA 2',3'-cyclic phosphodiesterase n=1 Tax=Micavibrio aeruginosavorus TaxID=349221 RepID=A0A2W5C0G4_9BACT|nr:MAG: RNA 2',3'-cyclic phosphodiesterase [Micavibrio aeruginosavorus]
MSGEGKVRLFTALDVPGALRDKIVALPKVKLDFQRITNPHDFHITLRFLGEVDQNLIPDIEDALDGMRKPAPFGVEVSGLGMFEKKRQCILYAAVQSVKKLSLLTDGITQKMEPLGLTFEKRAYMPHVTLARLRSTKNAEEYAKRYGRDIHASWQAKEFHLMRSASAEEGEKRYSILRTFALPPY